MFTRVDGAAQPRSDRGFGSEHVRERRGAPVPAQVACEIGARSVDGVDQRRLALHERDTICGIVAPPLGDDLGAPRRQRRRRLAARPHATVAQPDQLGRRRQGSIGAATDDVDERSAAVGQQRLDRLG